MNKNNKEHSILSVIIRNEEVQAKMGVDGKLSDGAERKRLMWVQACSKTERKEKIMQNKEQCTISAREPRNKKIRSDW